MGLKDEIEKYDGKKRRCVVGELLDTLDIATSLELQELLDDEKYSSAQLGRLAKAKQWGIVKDTWLRHRRKECCCVTER